MRVTKVLLFFALLLGQISFAKVGSIGTISPEYPKVIFKSEETKLFFDELVEMIYSQLDNAGTNYVNKLNYDADAISFKQASYAALDEDEKLQMYELIPSEFNFYAITEFYKNKKKKGKKLLKEIALKHKMDIVMYVVFNERTLRKILKLEKENSKSAEVELLTRTYYLQNNAEQAGHVKFTIKDIFGFPEFNQDAFESKLSQEFLESYKTALGILNVTGESDFSEVVESSEKSSKSEPIKSDKANATETESDGW